MQKLIINTFPGAINLPLWAGTAQAYFAARDLELEMVMTPNSVEQLTGLAARQVRYCNDSHRQPRRLSRKTGRSPG